MIKTLFTKSQIADICLRPIKRTLTEHIHERMIDELVSYPDWKFIKLTRQATKLKICKFAPNLYYIRYE